MVQIFLSSFLGYASDWILVSRLWLRFKQVNWKIMAIEMTIEIYSFF
jgi:hypothetical protein